MALVLREKTDRNGLTKRFDVVRADEGELHEILDGINEGQYKVLDGAEVKTVNVSYRTVQDIETV